MKVYILFCINNIRIHFENFVYIFFAHEFSREFLVIYIHFFLGGYLPDFSLTLFSN